MSNEETKQDTKGSSPKTQSAVKEVKAEAKKEEKKSGLSELFTKTVGEISALIKGVTAHPTTKYTGFKIGGKLVASIRAQKNSFTINVHVFDERGILDKTESFDIKDDGKETGAVISGILGQILKNCEKITKKAKTIKKAAETKEPVEQKAKNGEVK